MTNASLPTCPGAEWRELSSAEAGFSPNALSASLEGLPGNIVVVRHGGIVATKGDVRASIPLYSVGKSLTALVFGTLLARGCADYDDLVPGSDVPRAPLASYRQFLNMTSDFGLDPHLPGAHYAYNNKAIDHYGRVMSVAFFGGADPATIVDRAFWRAIGRQDPLGYAGMWGGWGGGFAASARDIARVGLLVLHGGAWNGLRMVPPCFVAELYASQVPPSASPSPSSGIDAAGDNTWYNQRHITREMPGCYSFGWWLLTPEKQAAVRGAVAYASGKNGNKIIVAPAYDLVVAVTWDGDTYPGAGEYLLPIVAAMV